MFFAGDITGDLISVLSGIFITAFIMFAILVIVPAHLLVVYFVSTVFFCSGHAGDLKLLVLLVFLLVIFLYCCH